MELLNSIIGFIIAIGILVTFHEYGHFIVARLCNVKVLKFSVGFGRPIYSYTSKSTKTEYSLCMIPLGGYVQMLESKNADGDSNDIKESDYKDTDKIFEEPKEFNLKISRWDQYSPSQVAKLIRDV